MYIKRAARSSVSISRCRLNTAISVFVKGQLTKMEVKLFICILYHLLTFATGRRFGRFFSSSIGYRGFSRHRNFYQRAYFYNRPRRRFNYFDNTIKVQRFFRDYGDTLEDCRQVKTVEENFCNKSVQRVLFEFQRPVSGICNNLSPGMAAVGAADTQVARLVPAKYFDDYGLDTPLGHPSLPDEPRSAQEISDIMLDVTFTDLGNNKRVSHIFMTFGQFMDHDFAYVIHGPSSLCPETCRIEDRAFDYPCNNIRPASSHSRCVSFVRSFAVCQEPGQRQVREHPNNITHYVDGSMIYGSTDRELEQLRNGTSAFMKVLKSKKGTLLPINFNSDAECRERGGCFLAGDRRVNENTALASMHTAWVRLHNVYAQLISEEFDKEPQSFESSLKSKEEKDERIFQESRKIVIACLQHIFYEEWLAKLNITLPNYDGYNPNVKAEVSQAFITAAFRFGHTLVPNFFPQLSSNYSRARRPLSVRESFFNNIPIFENGIEETLRGLYGDYEEAENFDTTFSGSIAKTLFIPPTEAGFQNLLALNTQRGRDHGLPSYSEYRKQCGISDALPNSNNPFSIYRNEIIDPRTLEQLKITYGNPNNHVDLFVAGMAESNNNKEFLGPTFKCIIGKTLANLRDGDRFFYENIDQFSIGQQEEVKKMTLAKVMCLILRDGGTIQENLFDVFNPRKQKRINCENLLKDSLNVKQWLTKSLYKL